jgi:hypothetical protein
VGPFLIRILLQNFRKGFGNCFNQMGVWLLLPAHSPTVDLDLVVGLVLLGSQKVQPVVAIVVQELESSSKFVAAVGIGRQLRV